MRPRGDLFVRECEKLEDSVNGLLRAGYELFLVDLSGIEYIGSSGIGVMVWMHKRMQKLEGRVIYVSAPEKVRRVLELMELTMLELAASEEEAFAILGKEKEESNENRS